jgi:hypothetical protein
MNRFVKFFHRIGYYRAAGEMRRMGRHDLATALVQMAAEL